MYGRVENRLPAFTLIEILVVLAILMLLMGALAKVLINVHTDPAASDIHLISMALDQYFLDHKRPPPDTGFGLRMDSGSPHYDPGSLWRYLCNDLEDPKSGLMKRRYLDWPQNRLESYEDPLRGKSFYLADPWGNPFGFIGDERRKVHKTAPSEYDLFSPGRDGITACPEGEQDPNATGAAANRAYNGRDDDGNGTVDDREELGAARENGAVGDDSNNWDSR